MHHVHRTFRWLGLVAIATVLFGAACASAPLDPLPSWNEGLTKQAIIRFVRKVTTADSVDFVPVAERVAAFDNDGTLWVEQPMYAQFVFVLDRIRQLEPGHPEWHSTPPFSLILQGDIAGALAGGDKSILALIAATSSGMTTVEFDQMVASWLNTARDPRFDKPYTALVYKPMLELMAYLRANDFKTYIVSGGGIDFMRQWTERVYGVPPEQVIGSSGMTKFEIRDGVPVLVRLPDLGFIDDGPGKPSAIELHIGRKPILAFGNSDGDLPMLQWVAEGKGPHFVGLVHHTDASREWAYDRSSNIGKLDVALDEATQKGWPVVDMKEDWISIFSFNKR